MSVVSFVNQKGGCAKSTTCVHFAVWLSQKQKQDVVLVDADAQQSSSLWLSSLDVKIPFEVLTSPDDLLDKIPELAKQYKFVAVDGSAALSESTRSILFRSDLAIIPCQPTGVDLRSASDAVRLVRQAQSVRGGEPKAALFLSRAVKGTRLLNEAIAVLKKTEIPILETVIYQRQVVADTFGQGATVWEMTGKPASDSAEEFDRLFKEILRML
jgi:chromosome partitioning protein